jgi:hypothetical protein
MEGPSTDPRQKTDREGAADMAALFVIIVIGVIVRAYYLSLPIKYDEAFTFLEFAQQPILSGISNYSFPNNHILHTLFVHLSVSLFGLHDWALRLPAFVFGALVIPATYWLGWILSKGEAALVAAALVAGSSKLIEYSVNARGYTLLMLFSIALVAIGFHLIRAATVRAWAAFAVVVSLGFFTIPTMLYVYAAVLLWVTASRGPDRVTLKCICIVSLAAFSITAVLYLPALLHSGPRALLANPYVHPRSLHEFRSQALTLPSFLWESWTAAVPVPVLIALLIGLTISMFRDRLLIGLLLSFVTAVTALMVLQWVIPPSRVFLFVLPILAICASSGLLRLLIRWRGISRVALVRIAAIVLAAWMGLAVVRTGSVVASTETGSFQDAAEVMEFLNAATSPRDLVLMHCPVDAPFRYYLQSRATGWVKGPGDSASDRLFIVLRDHQGPRPTREEVWGLTTLNDIRQSYAVRSEPKLAMTAPYTSVYIAEGATVEDSFCDAYCFYCVHKARVDR